jgi:hypothetical protein
LADRDRCNLAGAERPCFRLSLGNVYWGADMGEREKLTGSVLMQAQAAVGSWDRPDGANVKPIRRHPFNPVLHGPWRGVVRGANGSRGHEQWSLSPHDANHSVL